MRLYVTTTEILAAMRESRRFEPTSRKALLMRAERERWLCKKAGSTIHWVVSSLPEELRLCLVWGPQHPVFVGAGQAPPLPNRGLGELNGPPAGGELNGPPAGVSQAPVGELPMSDPLGDLFVNASDKARELAILRSALIHAQRKSGLRAAKFIPLYNAGTADPLLFEQLGKVTLNTFYRWDELFRNADDNVAALLPQYNFSRTQGMSLTEEEKRLLRYFYLNENQLNMKHCYRLLLENLPNTKANYDTCKRYLKSLEKPIVDRYRLGKTVFSSQHLPYVDRAIEQYNSLDIAVSDHHCLDCVCLYKGKLVRPWITTFQDYRSGKILGWCLSVNPSSLSIICAYYMTCITHGVPRAVLFDNGKDYRSKLLNGYNATLRNPKILDAAEQVRVRGVFELVGSEVHFTIPYHGQSKGRQERFFALLGEYIAKPSGGYVGSDTATRPERAQLFYRKVQGQENTELMPTFEGIKQACNNIIPLINDTFISRGKGMEDKTRSQVFLEHLPDTVRRADKAVLEFALSRGHLCKVRNSMVLVQGTYYWAEQLAQYSGSEVQVRQSLLDASEVTICDLQGRRLFSAQADAFQEVAGDPGLAIAKVQHEQKRRLTEIAEFGAREVQADPAFKTMFDVASNIYSQNESSPRMVDEFLLDFDGGGPDNSPPNEVGVSKRLKTPFDF